MYGLKRPLKEKMRNKPPPLPVTLVFESTTLSEKRELEKEIKRFKSTEYDVMRTGDAIKDLSILTDVVAKYDSISTALKVHRDIIKETRELIAQISNSEHGNILNRLLGPKILLQHVSQNE